MFKLLITTWNTSSGGGCYTQTVDFNSKKLADDAYDSINNAYIGVNCSQKVVKLYK